MGLNKYLYYNSYFPKFSKWIFFVSILLLSFYYQYHEILFMPAQGLHLWRQADCLSISLNYLQDQNNFFQPSVHNLGRSGTGRAVSDFPLIYFTVAKLWNVFGQHEYIFRLINLLIFYSGIFALFRLIEDALKSSVLAILLSLLLFTSPVIAYYANNFLMNVPALSFALIGFYLFYLFTRSGRQKYFTVSILFYLLAGLLKVTSLFSFFAIFGVFLLELFGVRFQNGKKIFSKPLYQLWYFVFVFGLLAAWYIYAGTYNRTYFAGYFLVGILPVWNYDWAQINRVVQEIMIHVKWDYFRQETQILAVLLLALTLVFVKKANKLFLILSLLMGIGMLIFVVLFFQALEAHDYYVTNLLILIPFVFISFFLLLKNSFPKISNSILVQMVLLLFIFYNADFSKTRIGHKYSEEGWENRKYVSNLKYFKEIGPYIESLGIKKEDKVISLSDKSINISLYLMNQKGWSKFGIHPDSATIQSKINQDAKYLFIYDSRIYEDKSLDYFLKNKIGRYKTIDIYKL